MTYLIFLFLIFYFLFCLIRLDWAVLLVIVLLPSYLIRFQILGVPFTLLEGMILISFFVWFFRYTNFKNFLLGKYSLRDFKNNRLKREKYPFGIEIILLLIISFIAVGISGFSNEAFGIWKAYFFEPALFFILILNVVNHNSNALNNIRKSRINIEKIILALAVSAFGVSLFAFYQKFTGAFIYNEFWQTEATRRVTSFFSYPNAVGLYLAPIVLILLGFLFYVILSDSEGSRKNHSISFKQRFFAIAQNDKAKILFFALVIILSLSSIYFAKSEGALIGVIIGLIVFGLFVNKKTAIATIIGIIIVGVGISFYTPARQFAYEKIILMDHSGQIRRAQWQETWEMLRDGRIIQGAGLANYQEAVRPYHSEGIFIKDIFDPDFQRKVLFDEEFHKKAWQPLEIYLYPHNIFLNFWVELGLFGMLLFTWIILKYFLISFKNYKLKTCLSVGKVKNFENSEKYITLGLISAMTAIVIHGLVDVPYFKNDLSVFFWLLVALISIKRLEYRKVLN